MKNLKNKTLNPIAKKQFKNIGFMALVMMACVVPVFGADTGVAEFNKVILFLADWVTKIGAGVALFGGVQTILGFKNDNPDGKVSGLKTLATGFMLIALCNPVTVQSLFNIG